MNSATLSEPAFWNAYVPVASVVGGFATGLAAGLALAALIVGYWQIRRSATIAREMNAFEAHQQYILMCVEYPMWSSFNMAVTHLPSKSVQNILEQETVESERYLWFISVLLNAGEKILLAMPKDSAWRCTVRDQIAYHRGTIYEIWPSWAAHYSRTLRDVVLEAVPELQNAQA